MIRVTTFDVTFSQLNSYEYLPIKIALRWGKYLAGITKKKSAVM